MTNKIAYQIECKRRLQFHPKESWLWQIMPDEVLVWDLDERRVRYSCAGRFVGMARDGSSFITVSEGTHGHAWNAATGQERPLHTIDSDKYEFHHRAVAVQNWEQNKSTLDVHDLLGEYPLQTIDVGYRPQPNRKPFGPGRELLVGWVLLPERRLAALLWGVGGFDHTLGKVFDLDFFDSKFDENLGTFGSYYPGRDLFRLEPSGVLVSAGILHSALFDHDAFPSAEKNAQARTRFKTDEGDCTLISVHPQRQDEYALVVKRTGHFDSIQVMRADSSPGVVVIEVVQELAETGMVVALTHQPNGESLATLLDDGDIHLWHLDRGVIAQTLSTQPKDGRIDPPAPDEHAIKKNWERQPQRPFLQFHPSKRLMWQEGDGYVRVWEMFTGTPRYEVPGDWVGRARDGASFLTLVEGEAKAWHTDSGEEIPLAKISPADYDVAQRTVLTGQPLPAAVYGWDVFGLEPAKTFFPFSLSSGERLETWRMDAQGKYLFMAMMGSDEMAHVACYDWHNGRYLHQYDRDAWHKHFYFSPLLPIIATAYNSYRFYELASGKRLAEMFPRKSGMPFCFHPRLEWLCAVVSGWENELVWGAIGDVPENETLPPPIKIGKPVVGLAIAPDGEMAVTLLKSGEVQFWDIERGMPFNFA